MDFQKVLEEIKKKNDGAIPEPVQALANLSEGLVIEHVQAKKRALAEGAISLKDKYLILLASAISLDTSSCILMYIKGAKKNGATKDEIMETFALAKYAKSTTVLPNSKVALEWLYNNI